MNRKTVIRLLIILTAIVAGVVFVYPSVSYYTMPMEQRVTAVKKTPAILKQIFNLGLDLQGGMRLVLEVDRSNLKADEGKDVLDRAYTVIANRIDALGVAEPSIQKQGADRLVVELPGLKDEAAAKAIIGRTAQLQFNLQREVAQLERAVRAIDKALQGELVADTAVSDSARLKEEEAQALAERVFGGTEKAADTAAAAQADTAAAGGAEDASDGELLKGMTSFRDLLAQVGEQVGSSPENKARIDAVLRRKDVRTALENAGLGGNVFMWGHDTMMVRGAGYQPLYYLKAKPEMAGDVIKDARQELDRTGLSGGYEVDLELNRKGARRFSTVTGANVGRNLAIVLDSTVYSAPVIKTKIPFGQAQITGSFTMEEARNLAIVLRAGALPAPLTLEEERTIGPSLGQDSIRKGIIAAIAGLAGVMLFMAFYYRLSGLIADIALVLNMLFTLAIMAGINATLTLPGIAGLVLMLGMAVDSNVLILERIREELRVGKTVRSAVDAGYRRAFSAIFDSNITTLLTGFILLWFGTGPIKGFAITLIFGIAVSFFTAIFVTRTIYDIVLNNPKVTSISV